MFILGSRAGGGWRYWTGGDDDDDGAASNDNGDVVLSKELIAKYSNLKASIFSRYRTLSELLGVLLLKEAQSVNINTMCETSGRDIAMFHYIDHFFPDRYNKLALHFTINDLSHAKSSVDDRMVREMKMGREALDSGDVVEVIYANAGGPYGSEVLEGVQADSDRVWDEVVMKGEEVGGDWYKATMKINARADKPWTIQAVRPDGSLGTEYTFGDPRTVWELIGGDGDRIDAWSICLLWDLQSLLQPMFNESISSSCWRECWWSCSAFCLGEPNYDKLLSIIELLEQRASTTNPFVWDCTRAGQRLALGLCH